MSARDDRRVGSSGGRSVQQPRDRFVRNNRRCRRAIAATHARRDAA
jgi:hypothetical protein